MSLELSPQVTAIAPGRVNLMGEHTDYNQGFVLPTILPLQTTVQVAIAQNKSNTISDQSSDQSSNQRSNQRSDHRFPQIDCFSLNLQEHVQRQLDGSRRHDWTDYVFACLEQLQQRSYPIPDLNLRVESTIPMGAGVSSSAALEVAVLKAMRSLLQLPISDVEIALLAQQAESQGVGVPCGIMDQLVSAVGVPHQALFLDTQSLQFELIPLPENYNWAVVHSGKTRSLSESGYAQRRQECEQAAIALQVNSLRQVTSTTSMTSIDERIQTLPEPLGRRVKHVVTENQRVLDCVAALRQGQVEAIGELMNQSQRSQQFDFQVTVPETEALCAIALEQGALGARQTGGGFGGAIVALVPSAIAPQWLQSVQQQQPKASLISWV
jgi:galactokinase